MNRRFPLLALAAAIPALGFSQTAIDAMRFSQPDLRGTARFMSMGGAFGALGGDLSSLSQNPAGIGVYRSSDIGFTLNLDAQSAKASTPGSATTLNQTKFYLNNIGGVFAIKLPSATVPNIDVGFTYNKTTSFNRRYAGSFPTLSNSMSNYIAGITNNGGNAFNEGDLTATDGYNPYNPTDGGIVAPWLSILGYEGFLITPEYEAADVDRKNPRWFGQWGNGTSGSGRFNVEERGCVDSYNIALGGNFGNIVYWGMDFDITHLDYSITSSWGENLKDAYVEGDQGIENIPADWTIGSNYSASGTGFNYKLGVIVKPIQELRLGFAFHTPTYYSLSQTYSAGLGYAYNGGNTKYIDANKGIDGYNDMNFRTPWRFIASAATVLFNKLIISADYEWSGYRNMQFSTPNYGYYDYGYDWDYGWDNPWDYPYYYAPATRANAVDNPYNDGTGFGVTNHDIRDYMQHTNTLRLGAEYRVTPGLSVRAGYSFVSSPINSKTRNNKTNVYPSGDIVPSFRLDNTTNYVTLGVGYKVKWFYADLAYVYKHQSSTFHAYPQDITNPDSPQADLDFSQNQVVLTMGVRF